MSATRPDILNRILARKQQEISQRQQNTSLESLQHQAREASTPRGFIAALKRRIEHVLMQSQLEAISVIALPHGS